MSASRDKDMGQVIQTRESPLNVRVGRGILNSTIRMIRERGGFRDQNEVALITETFVSETAHNGSHKAGYYCISNKLLNI